MRHWDAESSRFLNETGCNVAVIFFVVQFQFELTIALERLNSVAILRFSRRCDISLVCAVE